jgi:hypothetical protein
LTTPAISVTARPLAATIAACSSAESGHNNENSLVINWDDKSPRKGVKTRLMIACSGVAVQAGRDVRRMAVHAKRAALKRLRKT